MPPGAQLVAATYGPLETAGPVLVWVIVLGFVLLECAFIVGLFLPGDSLLLTAGVVLAAHHSEHQAWWLAGTATVVAIVGNQVGYQVGTHAGTKVLARKGGRVLNRKNLLRATDLMHRYGFWAVVIARWIPWVRTLAPMLAGAAHMNPRRYLLASSLGALIWVPTLLLLGYYGAGLLDTVPWLLHTAVAVLVVLLVVGTAWGLFRYRQEVERPEDPDVVPAPDLPALDH
ncbi:DedA family protein [Rhodococcus sp. X156]|uniref:DedA family protein n=1 Tax=Rhodococcus sp. X156 TaxID=2499145 RepID=UPI001F49F183|nr:DedA family protein [Rhodococcus sp. X156]